MLARDVMTTDVVSVGPETPSRRIAALLLEKGISAVPVVDSEGAPIGMVSEGDLIGRGVKEREARRDWWLEMLAEGDPLASAFVDHVKSADQPARQIMIAPVVTVGENTPVNEIAELIEGHRIKRVPVLRAGRVVGIVSRADVVRALAHLPQADASRRGPRHSTLGAIIGAVETAFHHDASRPASPAPQPARPEPLSAGDFRRLVEGHERLEQVRGVAERSAAALTRSRQIGHLLDEHIADGPWRDLLHRAREAAERGEKEYLLLRFPSELCSDGGRAINAPDPDWSRTLRGEAADLYLRYERELEPAGFAIVTRVLDFPGGFPGDIGLYLRWGA